MKRILWVLCISVGAVFTLAGCNMAPKYSRPAAPVPPEWNTGLSTQEAQTPPAPPAPDLRWQDFFTDEKLRQVIEQALKNNRDLRIAALNVERVQAQYRLQNAQLYPTLNAGASAQMNRVPKDLSSTGQAYTLHEYELAATASWELDLFGRIRSLKKQALEQYLATDQARSATQISLVAAVATGYFTLAADRESLRLAQSTLESQQATYEMILHRRDMGISSDLDLSQAQSQVQAAQVDVARYSGLVTQDENALDLLVGAPVAAKLQPGELGREGMMKDVSAGLPSDALLHRPDILSAEHQLKAAYANIGAARAAFFPQLSLTAAGGVASNDLTALFQGSPGVWSFAPQIVAPIFDAGTRRANLKIAKVDRDAALTSYEKSIQTAFREISDSLALRTRLRQQQDAQQALVNSLETTYSLSDARYKAGVDSYLSVLVAQRSLYGGQQALVTLRAARLSNLVTLYKVLGGGV
jgi:multidrug efflux system outer membrane protein